MSRDSKVIAWTDRNTDRQTHRHDWKHYLTVCVGGNEQVPSHECDSKREILFGHLRAFQKNNTLISAKKKTNFFNIQLSLQCFKKLTAISCILVVFYIDYNLYLFHLIIGYVSPLPLTQKHIKLRLYKTEKKRDTYMQMYEMNLNYKTVS